MILVLSYLAAYGPLILMAWAVLAVTKRLPWYARLALVLGALVISVPIVGGCLLYLAGDK
jgi:hypothetical protein